MHIRPICTIHIATDSTFGLVCVLSVIGPWHSAMTTALLAARVEVADSDGLATAILPFNLNIGVVHHYHFSQHLGHR